MTYQFLAQEQRRRPERRQRRAAAVVEFAVILPLIMTLLLGLWEFGRLVEVQQILSNGARETARQAASGGLQLTNVQAVACQYLRDAGLNDYTSSASSVVTFKIINNLQSPAASIATPSDPSSLQYLDEFTVTLTIPTADVLYFGWTLPGSASYISITVTWMAIADQAPSTFSEPPTG